MNGPNITTTRRARVEEIIRDCGSVSCSGGDSVLLAAVADSKPTKFQKTASARPRWTSTPRDDAPERRLREIRETREAEHAAAHHLGIPH